MIQISEDDIKQARDLIAHGDPEAFSYRLIIKPIEAVTTLTKSESQEFPTLAKMEFQDKTETQADKLSTGTHHGILCHIGYGAFQGDLAKFYKVLPKEGDVVIFDRYGGVEMELPPGSGNMYRFMNDETLLGRMVKANG